ncbi:MAG: threonine synthase, partial [Treponema sp.]|nr:threonine synthase [Treponema sp.]
TLTSALISTEFSPIICEAIATRAFSFEPAVRQLDDKLFIMELDKGPTGTFRDFGVSYLISTLETLLQMEEEKAILLTATSGELGACLAHATRGKELVKAVLLAPKGKLRGIKESDFVWNGGGIYPIEVDGTQQDCNNIVRKLFKNRELVKKCHLTVANTANIGRLLPQAFFYTFAFSRIKKLVPGDIFYAMATGNYGNIVSGLLSWQLSLPVNGFILPSTANLKTDARGNAIVMDSMVPLDKRDPIDPSDPSNLERLENTFKLGSLMLRNFVYPAEVSKEAAGDACRDLFVKYKVFADHETSAAYQAARLRRETVENDDGTVVLIARDSPSLDEAFIKRNIGELPPKPESIMEAFTPTKVDRPVIASTDTDYVISVLNSLNLRRIF